MTISLDEELSQLNDEQLQVRAADSIRQYAGAAAAYRFHVTGPTRERCIRVIREWERPRD